MRVPRTSKNFKYEFIEFKKFYNINKKLLMIIVAFDWLPFHVPFRDAMSKGLNERSPSSMTVS